LNGGIQTLFLAVRLALDAANADMISGSRRRDQEPRMNLFTFQVPSTIPVEPGASAKLPSLVAEFGARRILLVTDRGAS
jgi:hypothetical protein